VGTGELAAVFRALARDVAQAGRRVAASIARLADKTADIEEGNLARLLETDSKAADNMTAAGKKPDIVAPADSAGGPAGSGSVSRKLSSQRQARHVAGDPHYNGGGYFRTLDDAQHVLDAYHDGSANVLGVTPNGNIVVRCSEVVGFNNNPRAGYLDQPTSIFMIKGSKSPSVVPINPNWSMP
jgi:hypothetical protein